ncbi:putative branched-chain amino acid transport permease [Sinorhizobium meliloti CCNWSX0020]|uniref:Putative branched-chain amino acid transport permease n=1 Tax=Sinorhizobium meliloti CCNWSX0020 TaxID=1107881 RepID=H0G715_RHIML|nr:branched-chain amino acid ABC transporter permease [Sinorhizobium meliloti]EHK74917.1 putative branched-chain amino acid transport permease [Sinorhizobium meliloti CCNWSX0020]
MITNTLARMKLSNWVALVLIAAFAVAPLVAHGIGQPFYIVLISRIMIFAIAAIGVNLALGYVGMVSLGHALYIGIGAYAVAISLHYGFANGWAHLMIALVVGAAVAVPIGLVCLRTSGFGFVMITLAFSQMFFYLAVGLRQYGGDEGMPLPSRSSFLPLDAANGTTFYYMAFFVLMLVLFLLHRLIHARFGMVIRGCKLNEARMKALGFSTLRHKLVAYVISAEICVLAGVLLANLTRFATPSYLEWIMSGDLVVMTVLGGAGTLIGPLVGATVWVVLEELLASFYIDLPWNLSEFIRSNWIAALGIVIIIVTLTLKKGLYGFLVARDGGAR